MAKNYKIIPGEGDPCPRCKRPTQIREHSEITAAKELTRPFYYSRWFNCANTDCPTTLLMPPRYRVHRVASGGLNDLTPASTSSLGKLAQILQTSDGWWAVHVIAGPFATEQEAFHWTEREGDTESTSASTDERPPWE